jgi:hypothetical protein
VILVIAILPAVVPAPVVPLVFMAAGLATVSPFGLSVTDDPGQAAGDGQDCEGEEQVSRLQHRVSLGVPWDR